MLPVDSSLSVAALARKARQLLLVLLAGYHAAPVCPVIKLALKEHHPHQAIALALTYGNGLNLFSGLRQAQPTIGGITFNQLFDGLTGNAAAGRDERAIVVIGHLKALVV